MKLLLGVVLGAVAAWFYRTRGQRDLGGMNQFVEQGKQTVSTAATVSAQRVGQVIDRTPIPPQAKDVARRITSVVHGGQAGDTGQSGPTGQTGGGTTPEAKSIGVPGVESAAGRDRTKDGDLPPDLATP
jgi:hypothetical protein